MIASVIAHFPGHARPSLLFRGEAPEPALVQTLLAHAKERGGKATIALNGTKMLNLAHYEQMLTKARHTGPEVSEDGAGPILTIIASEDLTEEVMAKVRQVARSKRFRLSRIYWDSFYAALEGVRLRGGARLSLGPPQEMTPAKKKIARHVRDLRARERQFDPYWA